MNTTNTTATQDQLRRESWIFSGWGGADDDVPTVPDLSPMSSAQARRAALTPESRQTGLQASPRQG